MKRTGTAPARVDAAPLAIASVVDQVYYAIHERIVQGSLERGARIHQEDLAEDLGVSRTPVREALRRLAAEGLVEMRTNRGARVADAGEGDMRLAYEARLVIEPGAARLAAGGRPPGPIARMRAALTAQRRAIPDVPTRRAIPDVPQRRAIPDVPTRRAMPDVRRSFDANREFHIALVQASGNDFLLQFVQRLWVARIGEVIYERQSETPERMSLDADEHEQILAAIEAGNGRLAESLTRRHVADAMRRATDLLQYTQSAG